VTLEDNAVAGGAGSGVNELLASSGRAVALLNLGLPDRFVEHASRTEQLADCGLDSAGILRAIQKRLRGQAEKSELAQSRKDAKTQRTRAFLRLCGFARDGF
jgi:deoxyxylulose-5-phosphate synthase